MRFDGAVDATEGTVAQYLKQNYAKDGRPMTDIDISNIVARHADKMATAISLRSFAHYVGDQIADAENLDWIPEVYD